MTTDGHMQFLHIGICVRLTNEYTQSLNIDKVIFTYGGM